MSADTCPRSNGTGKELLDVCRYQTRVSTYIVYIHIYILYDFIPNAVKRWDPICDLLSKGNVYEREYGLLTLLPRLLLPPIFSFSLSRSQREPKGDM